MDFPITEHETSSRHATGNSQGRAGSDSHVGAFADLLSADRFSDLSNDPVFDEAYEELDTLTSRDDRADEDSAYVDGDATEDSAYVDDDATDDVQRADTEGATEDNMDDSGADYGDPDTDGNKGSADSASDDGGSVQAEIMQSLKSGANLIGGTTVAPTDSSVTRSMQLQAGGDPAGTQAPQGQIAVADPQIAAAGAANLGEARVLNRRSQVLQGNAQHAAAVKSQLAKAESSGADATARTTDTAKPATATQEAPQPKSEAGRLEQAFRAAFPQTTSTPAATPASNPALPQTSLGAQNGLTTDGLSLTSAGDGSDSSPQIQSSAERTSSMAATKAAATRNPFTLPGSRPAEQVSVQIQNAARNGTDRISIRLSPAALGKVEVKLELAPDKTVHAIVSAEKPETLDMLERDARTLQRALEDAGLRTNSDSLSFERRDPDGTADAWSDSDQNASNGTERSGNSDDTDGSGQLDVELSSRRHHDGLLDMEV